MGGQKPHAPAPRAPTTRAPTPRAPAPRAPTPRAPAPRAPTPHAPAPRAPTPHAPAPRAPNLYRSLLNKVANAPPDEADEADAEANSGAAPVSRRRPTTAHSTIFKWSKRRGSLRESNAQHIPEGATWY